MIGEIYTSCFMSHFHFLIPNKLLLLTFFFIPPIFFCEIGTIPHILMSIVISLSLFIMQILERNIEETINHGQVRRCVDYYCTSLNNHTHARVLNIKICNIPLFNKVHTDRKYPTWIILILFHHIGID